MPSVLANDIPLATLSVDNIQVRAEWKMVGDSANHFSVEGGTLMLTADIEEGDTFIATVEVRDKFSTLNPNYEDLATTVRITAVIIGCPTDEWTRNLAKAYYPRNGGNPSNQIAVESGAIKRGDVIARRYTANGYNHIYLYTVNIIVYKYLAKTYITTKPSLYGHLTKFDSAVTNPGYTSFPINESGYCFIEEVKTFQEQDQNYQEKTEYLNVHAPLISGFYAGKGRTVTVGTAFVYDGKQHFYLYNVTLANILNEIYTTKVIIDDGKAFSIDNKYQSGNRYEYVANLTVGSGSVQNQGPHGVIVVNDCPPIIEATVSKPNRFRFRVYGDDIGKVRTYMILQGKIYANVRTGTGGGSSFRNIYADGLSTADFSNGDYPVKFADHFLCENIGG